MSIDKQDVIAKRNEQVSNEKNEDNQEKDGEGKLAVVLHASQLLRAKVSAGYYSNLSRL
jgi:hypothetical protein